MKYMLFALIILTSACSEDPVKQYLDKKFPPVSVENQQKKAVQSLSESLSKMELPAISIGASISKVESVIADELKQDPAVKSVSIKGGEQILNIALSVDKTFTKDAWKDEENVQKILGDSDISFVGVINISLTLTANLSTPADVRVLSVNVLPMLNSVLVKKVKSDEIKAELAAEALFFLINRYADNLNSVLAKLPILESRIPVDLVDTKNPSDIIVSKKDADVKYSVTITSNNVTSPVRVGGQAVLIDQSHLRVMVAFVPVTRETGPEPHKMPENFQQAQTLFSAIHQEAFGSNAMKDEAWVALSKNLISLTVNSVINQTEACFDLKASVPTEQIPSTKIPGPDWESISCKSVRDCRQTRDCTFTKSHDTRDCEVCLATAPRICLPNTPWGEGSCSGGQCIKRGNNPFCEAAKAAQNVIYEADYAQKKGRCEVEREAARIGCEAEKATEKGFCEAGKEVVKRIALAGDVARIDGKIGGNAKGKVCLNNIAVENDLSKIQLNMEIGGSVDINGHLKVTPLNLGHTICIAPTTAPLDFNVKIPAKSQSLVAEIDFEERDGEFGLAFNTKEMKFPVRLSPSPSEWILSNVDMSIKCPITNLAKPVIIMGTPFVPELRGITEHKQEGTENFIKLNVPTQKIGNTSVRALPSTNEKALFLIAN